MNDTTNPTKTEVQLHEAKLLVGQLAVLLTENVTGINILMHRGSNKQDRFAGELVKLIQSKINEINGRHGKLIQDSLQTLLIHAAATGKKPVRRKLLAAA